MTEQSSQDRVALKVNAFKSMCLSLAELSHDPKFKVGTIIITPDFREICALGYNGNYRGGPNTRESLETGKSGFLHSEENALLHLCKPYELRSELILICTHKSCPQCAKRIVNGNIKNVWYINEYDAMGPGTEEIFQIAGVTLKKI